MCVTTGPAKLSNTIIYTGTGAHNGKSVHVLGYQNTVQNLEHGPNCMLLHIPTKEPLGKDNFIRTDGKSEILKDITNAFRPLSKGFSPEAASMSRGFHQYSAEVKIFKHDIYTVLSSRSVEATREVLNYLPVEKKPKIDDSLFEFYATHFPEWSFLLFLFDNKDMKDSNPILCHYTPINPEVLFAPTLDAHTGQAPDMREQVFMDHDITFGFHSTLLKRKSEYLSHSFREDEIIIQKPMYKELRNYLPIAGNTLTYRDSYSEPNGDVFLRWTETGMVNKGLLKL